MNQVETGVMVSKSDHINKNHPIRMTRMASKAEKMANAALCKSYRQWMQRRCAKIIKVMNRSAIYEI